MTLPLTLLEQAVEGEFLVVVEVFRGGHGRGAAVEAGQEAVTLVRALLW